MMKTFLASTLILSFFHSVNAVTIYIEEFDGNTNGYNPDSATATAGGEWVDFSNRINGTEGYGTASTLETVLQGTSSANDPQIRSDFGFGIDKTSITQFQLRLRIDKDQNSTFDDTLANGDFSLFWGTDQYTSPGATNGPSQLNFNLGNPDTLTAESDGWTVATWNVAPGGLTQGTGPNLDSMRIDPTNLEIGNGDSFEIDYLKIDVVPEPSSAAFASLGIVSLLLRRKRS